jgi:hypothetical protein
MTIISRTALGLAATMALAAPAFANDTSGLSQVANFRQSPGTTARPLSYRNTDVVSNGTVTAGAQLYTAGTSATTPAAVGVKFSFLDTLTGYSRPLSSDVDALFSLSATSTSAAQSLGGHFFQNFDTGTISYKLATPVYKLDAFGNATGPALDNLLTVSFEDALLSAAAGGTTFLFGASTATSAVSFTSDFLTFGSDVAKQAFDFSIAGTASTPALALAGPDRSLRNFRATSVGEFSASAGAVPEPASWGLMLAGFGLVGGTLRLRRRAQTLVSSAA